MIKKFFQWVKNLILGTVILILGTVLLCFIIFAFFIAYVKGVEWFGGQIASLWFLFLIIILLLYVLKGFQKFGEWVTSISVLSSFVIFLFFLFITSLDIGFLSPSLFPDNVAQFITVKIIGSALGLVFGFLLFAQRLDVMNKQAKTAQDQFALAQRQHESLQHQIEATEYRHEYEQFNRACELLEDEKIRNRTEGIAKLRTLARTNPEEWHIRMVNALADFIRERSADDKDSPVKGFAKLLKTKEKDEEEADEKWYKLSKLKIKKAPADIEAAIRVIARRLTDAQKDVVQEHHKSNIHWPDLSRSWLCSITLNEVYLPKAILSNSFFTGTDLSLSDLSGAKLTLSHLDKISLVDTNVKDSQFLFTNLASVDFLAVGGRKKASFIECYYIEDEGRPILTGSLTPSENDEIAKPISTTAYWEKARDFSKRQSFLENIPYDEIILDIFHKGKAKRGGGPGSGLKG